MGAGGSGKKPKSYAVKVGREGKAGVYRRAGLEGMELVRLVDDRFEDLQEVVMYSLQHYSSNPFLNCSDWNYPLTYLEVLQMVKQFSSELPRLCPIRYGQLTCLGLFTSNQIDSFVAELACLLLGFTVIPMDLDLGLGEIRKIIIENNMKTILCSPDTLSVFSNDEECKKALKNIILSGNLPENYEASDQTSPTKFPLIPTTSIYQKPVPSSVPPRLSHDTLSSHISLILYTRGTTGPRKPVKVLQSQIVAAIAGLNQAVLVENSDIYLSFQSIATVFERNMLFLVMKSGGQVYFQIKKPDWSENLYYEAVFNTISSQNISIFRLNSHLIPHLLPTFELLDDQKPGFGPDFRSIRLPNLRLIVTDSDFIKGEVLERLKSSLKLQILQGYGLTEAAGYVLISDLQGGGMGKVGAPAGNVEIKLEEEEMKEGGRGKGRGKRLKLRFRTSVSFPSTNPGHWLDTCDWVTMHPNTELEFLSRSESPILTNPAVYASKIEATVQECPGVRECRVKTDGNRLICEVYPTSEVVNEWNSPVEITAKGEKEVDVKERFLEEVWRTVREAGLRVEEMPREMKCMVGTEGREETVAWWRCEEKGEEKMMK